MATGSASSQTRTPRADARRNIAAIVEAAAACLARDPDASIAEIAAGAGVGRITLYGHFKSRAELVEAVLARAIDEADAVLADLGPVGEPVDALVRMVRSSWEVVDRFRGVLHAAQRELPAERIRSAHDQVMAHILGVVERGRAAGTFRSDLPIPWLVSLAVAVMHTAAEDVEAGRLERGSAADHVAATLVAAYTPPGSEVPVLPRG